MSGLASAGPLIDSRKDRVKLKITVGEKTYEVDVEVAERSRASSCVARSWSSRGRCDCRQHRVQPPSGRADRAAEE